jgi:hypothetical protein
VAALRDRAVDSTEVDLAQGLYRLRTYQALSRFSLSRKIPGARPRQSLLRLPVPPLRGWQTLYNGPGPSGSGPIDVLANRARHLGVTLPMAE